MKDLPERAIKAVNAIIDDITSRSGLGNEWEAIDEGVQGEIITAWVGIIVREVGP